VAKPEGRVPYTSNGG